MGARLFFTVSRWKGKDKSDWLGITNTIKVMGENSNILSHQYKQIKEEKNRIFPDNTAEWDIHFRYNHGHAVISKTWSSPNPRLSPFNALSFFFRVSPYNHLHVIHSSWLWLPLRAGAGPRGGRRTWRVSCRYRVTKGCTITAHYYNLTEHLTWW